MFEPSRLRDRLFVLEAEVIPMLKSDMQGIRENLQTISSQVSKLILVVFVAGFVDSPVLMKTISSVMKTGETPVVVADEVVRRHQGGNEVIDSERK